MKKILKITLCTIMAITIMGCDKKIELKDSESVLVSFKDNSLNISVKDLYDELKEQYGTGYLVNMVDKKILNLKYETNDSINKYIDNQLEMYQTYYGGKDKFYESLQSFGYSSIEEFRENLLLDYKRELALKDYVKENITDSEINKYYKDKIYGDITASHILITLETTDSMTETEKNEVIKEADKKIEEILTKLKDGEDFHELAKTYSLDKETANNGGRLYSFNINDNMEQEFVDACLKLENGKYTTKAVKTKYGYHIIYKESQKEKPELNTVKQTIIDKLMEEKINNDNKLQYKALIELRKSYGITINDTTLNDNYNTAVNNWLYGD